MYDFDPYLNDYEMFGAIDAADTAVFGALATVYAVVFGIALLFGLSYYIMNGIALLRMAKRAGVKHGWLGFIPFADSWLLGRLSDVGSTRRHSGARLLGFSIAADCCAGGFIGAIVAIFVRLFAAGAFDGALTDAEAFALIMPSVASGIALWVAMFALLICVTVFQCMALYRIGVNFGSSGYGIALVLTAFFCQLATYIILLVLSGRTPKYTEGVVVTDAPTGGTQSDSVFQ